MSLGLVGGFDKDSGSNQNYCLHIFLVQFQGMYIAGHSAKEGNLAPLGIFGTRKLLQITS